MVLPVLLSDGSVTFPTATQIEPTQAVGIGLGAGVPRCFVTPFTEGIVESGGAGLLDSTSGLMNCGSILGTVTTVTLSSVIRVGVSTFVVT